VGDIPVSAEIQENGSTSKTGASIVCKIGSNWRYYWETRLVGEGGKRRAKERSGESMQAVNLGAREGVANATALGCGRRPVVSSPLLQAGGGG